MTQAALRVAGALWALDPALAQQRQFPAVDWATSYSLQADGVAPWFAREGGARWVELRRSTLELLQRGRELKDIAGLVGPDALQDADRLALESARVVQELVLAQSAYEPNDACSDVGKTFRLASLALALHERGLRAMEQGVRFEQLELGTARRSLAAFRAAPAGDAEARFHQAGLAIERLAGEGIR